MLDIYPHLKDERGQNESGRRLFLAGAVSTLLSVYSAGEVEAEDGLDPGGLTFRDFGTPDNGASFNRDDPMLPGGPNPPPARVLSIDNAGGFARVRFDMDPYSMM